jgi:hypothetical protein
VSPDGAGTLLDFGSALAAGRYEGVTVTVRPGFAPPEQFGDVATQGPWTDVYALAATAYYCLCGAPPADSLQRTFSDTLKRPTELGVELPATAEDALMSALVLDYHARTQHAGDLLQGLRAQTTTPTETKTTSAVSTETKTAPTETKTASTTSAETKTTPTETRTASTVSTETKTASMKDKTSGWEQAPRQHRRVGLRKVLLPLLILIPVVLIAGALVLARFGSSGSTSGDLEAVVTDQGVDPDTIDEATRSAEVTKVSFEKCVVSDEAIQ